MKTKPRKDKYPCPTQVLKTNAQIRCHIEMLIFNTLAWLKLDGYEFVVLLPGDKEHSRDDEAGMSINVQYPYKKFRISVQASTIEKMRGEKVNHFVWAQVEQSMFHEILHVILWRLEEIGRKRFTTPPEITEANEEAVDHLTHVIYPMVEFWREHKK